MGKQIIFLIFSLTSLFSCSGQSLEQKGSDLVDTTKTFLIGKGKVIPKKSFEYNSLLKYKDDTLALVTCSEYVYSPFGIINNESEIKKSLLKKFNVIKKQSDNLDFQVLQLNSNKLILFFDNDSEASKSSYIVKGEIYEEQISFSDGIHVGITRDDFYKTFFSFFPEKLQRQYNVVAFESCILGIRHIYTFKDDRLKSVRFECVGCNLYIEYE